MKTNDKIKQNIREEVRRIICSNIYTDEKSTLKWILQRFEEHQLSLSLEGLLDLSRDYSSFIAPNPYNHNTRRMYVRMELDGVMTYPQFIFELPRIWYTTLYRLIVEWNDESSEKQETAY